MPFNPKLRQRLVVLKEEKDAGILTDTLYEELCRVAIKEFGEEAYEASDKMAATKAVVAITKVESDGGTANSSRKRPADDSVIRVDKRKNNRGLSQRKSYSKEEKLFVVSLRAAGKSVEEISALTGGVSRSNIERWCANKEMILEKYKASVADSESIGEPVLDPTNMLISLTQKKPRHDKKNADILFPTTFDVTDTEDYAGDSESHYPLYHLANHAAALRDNQITTQPSVGGTVRFGNGVSKEMHADLASTSSSSAGDTAPQVDIDLQRAVSNRESEITMSYSSTMLDNPFLNPFVVDVVQQAKRPVLRDTKYLTDHIRQRYGPALMTTSQDEEDQLELSLLGE